MTKFYSKGKEMIRLTFDKPVENYSVFFEGKLYHFRDEETEFSKQMETTFNTFKPGNYTVDQPCKVERIGSVHIGDLDNVVLPIQERSRAKNYFFTYNPNMTTVMRHYTHTGEIQYNDRYKTLPIQWQEFIKLHEIGHFYYETEWKCDLFALINYLRMGLNESNAYYALSRVISRTPQNIERIKKLKESISKI